MFFATEFIHVLAKTLLLSEFLLLNATADGWFFHARFIFFDLIYFSRRELKFVVYFAQVSYR